MINLAWPGPAPAQTTGENVGASVDRIFAPWNKPDSPGCSLGVSRNGVTVYEKGYGMANLELGVPITPASMFHVASVSKSFTAMSVLLLEQRGRVSLDDEARQYLTELPNYGNRLTLRHLLSHTGGFRDVFLLQGLSAPRAANGAPNDEFVDILARQRGLNFTPGTEFEYSNGGYLLLATIVKRVSGQSLRRFADANIFKPLGMVDTHFHDDPTMVVLNRASGYSRSNDSIRVAVHADLGGIIGNAGLFTTTQDLLRWEQNFTDVSVGDRALLTAMETPAVLPGEEKGPYGLGLEIGEYRGVRTVGHSGGNAGYVTRVVRYPEQGLAVALLCNLDNIDVGGLANDVADIYFAKTSTTPSLSSAPAATSTISLSAEQLASKEGLYRDPSNEGLQRLFVRNGKLMVNVGAGIDGGWDLTPVSATRFSLFGGTIVLQFLPPEKGKAQEIRVTGDRPKPYVIQQLNRFVPSRDEVRAFAGAYTSSELQVTYTLLAHDSDLVIKIPGREDIVAHPIFTDAFAGAVVGVVKFSRDARKVVTGFTVNTSGVRGLRFDRVGP